MTDFFFRTEDLQSDEILQYFYDTPFDREIIRRLKGRTPIVVVGSRGVGKSLLLRVAEQELLENFQEERVLPVYVSFNRAALVQTSDVLQFQHWMLSRICTRIIRCLQAKGLIVKASSAFNVIAGGKSGAIATDEPAIFSLTEKYEQSWKEPGRGVSTTATLPSVDELKDAIEDLCSELDIKRIVLLIDEAAHIFIPEQQRQFFTLFRDLRSSRIVCHAAVYPGVTFYGDTFEKEHDATFLDLDRNILAPDYVDMMMQIVAKQADATLMTRIAQYGENFAVLCYAANGNPRTLLKTLDRAPRMTSSEVNAVIRDYYRVDIWSEYTDLGDKYPGHRPLIDWGRRFIEGMVLPDLARTNASRMDEKRSTSCFIWIHRDAPAVVNEAIRMLAYSGIVSTASRGIKATRAEIGTRYAINLGCVLAGQSNPVSTGLHLAKSLSVKKMVEFGSNHTAFKELSDRAPTVIETDTRAFLAAQLNKPIDNLDVSAWQKSGLRDLNLTTIKDVLDATDDKLMEIRYVGEKRARRMRNAAHAAVYEYLSG